MSAVDEPFEWDEANIAHLARHGVSPAQAEEVIRSMPLILGLDLRSGELRRREVGETQEGEVLTIVSIARGYNIRVVTGGLPTARKGSFGVPIKENP